jgi:phosphatidylinositol alpha-mannosyltransferase
LDVPGGVQFHVRDLAEELISRGHTVLVLAPAGGGTPLPDHFRSAGRAVPIPYNGSVARLNFGPVAARRARQWLAEGAFDLLHIHEPITPSLGGLALLYSQAPVVATFHSSQTGSRLLRAAYPWVRPTLEKILGVIAVSEDARRTVMDHLGADAVIIPNGVAVGRFAEAPVEPAWAGTPEAPTVVFLGRVDEPRKGLKVLLAALGRLREARPGLRLLVAGSGPPPEELTRAARDGAGVEVLGAVTDQQKASLLRGASVYVAPQLGGESFGIVLVEAMAAGAAVVASDLPAFSRVLDGGELGLLFRAGQADALARAVLEVLDGDRTGAEARREAARAASSRYDWTRVADQILAVYDTVAGI